MRNYVQGQWRDSTASESLAVLNPATGEELGRTPLSPAAEVDAAVQAAVAGLSGLAPRTRRPSGSSTCSS